MRNNRYIRLDKAGLIRKEYTGFSANIVCSYTELVTCFGRPSYVAKAYERVKIAINWALYDQLARCQCSIYEWKSTTRYSDHPSSLSLAALRKLPKFEWNIASSSKFDLLALQQWMSQKLGREVEFKQ